MPGEPIVCWDTEAGVFLNFLGGNPLCRCLPYLLFVVTGLWGSTDVDLLGHVDSNGVLRLRTVTEEGKCVVCVILTVSLRLINTPTVALVTETTLRTTEITVLRVLAMSGLDLLRELLIDSSRSNLRGNAERERVARGRERSGGGDGRGCWWN